MTAKYRKLAAGVMLGIIVIPVARGMHFFCGSDDRTVAQSLAPVPSSSRAVPGIHLAAASAGRPRYILEHGQGWSVCEAYFQNLNSSPRSEQPPMCDLKLDRVDGLREPNWEVLHIQQHLPLVHQIELILGRSRIEPEPYADFEQWKLQFQERLEKQGQKPRLRRTRMALVPEKYFEVGRAVAGGPWQIPTGEIQTILSYDVDLDQCDNDLERAKQRRPNSFGQYQTNLFIFDEATQRVIGSGDYARSIAGLPRVYEGRLYIFASTVPTDLHSTGFFHGAIRIKRFIPAYSPLPGNPPYLDHEICKLRFLLSIRPYDCNNAQTQRERVICGLK